MTAQKRNAKVRAIEAKLAALSELKEAQALVQDKQRKLIAKLLAENPKAQKKYDILQVQIESNAEMIEDATVDVKDAVLVLGETVKGERLQAVWSKGKTSWNTDQLLGFAKVHKKILEMRDLGDPSISIRKVKSND